MSSRKAEVIYIFKRSPQESKVIYTLKFTQIFTPQSSAQIAKQATKATTIDNPAPPLSLLDAPVNWNGLGPVGVPVPALPEGDPGAVPLLAG